MLKSFYIVVLVAMVVVQGLVAQNCPAPFSLGSDTTLCGGGSLLLAPSIFQTDPLEVTWSPLTDLVTTPGSQTATVSPASPTTYTLSIRSVTGQQLVNNGNFSQGNTGFTSDYTLWTGSGNMSEGRYRVTNNPQNVHGDFASCSDNGPGNGNMLVVNAASAPDNIWCQTISVSQGATYAFSVAITSVVATNPAELQFRINGQLIGSTFNAPPTNCNWLTFFELWDSGTNTTAELCINNQNTILTGNDFAIDDISFQLTCLTEASITVSPGITSVAALETVPALCDRGLPINLTDLLGANATPGGQFLLNGLPAATSLDPTALGAGSFTLSYLVGEAGCQERVDQVFSINEAPSAGEFAAGLADEMDFCNVSQGIFREHLLLPFTGDPGGVFSLSGGDTPATINPLNGDITFGEAPRGAFLVTYTIAATENCPGDETDFGLNFFAQPTLILGPDRVIDCATPVQTLANAGTPLANFTYTWTQDGVFLGTGQSISVSTPGVYQLRATSNDSPCSDSATVTVTARSFSPSMELAVTPVSCGTNNALINGSAAVTTVNNGTPPFLYSINDGIFRPDSVFFNLAPSTYTLSVEDAGGCTSDTTFTLVDPSDYRFNFTVNATERIEFGTTLPVGVQTNLPAFYLDSIAWFPAEIAPRGSTRISATADTVLFYQALVTTNEGCVFSASVLLEPFAPRLIYAPNAFSPNGDGVNDTWTVFTHPAVVAIRSAALYDRWGNTVFLSATLTGNNPELGWDGNRNGKPLPTGAYLWTVEVEVFDGRTERFSGEVILVR